MTYGKYKPMKTQVLIIDDDPIFRMIMMRMISNVDPYVICHECTDGELGLAALEPLQDSPDNIIVLLDINMPILDGWGLLDHLEKRNFHSPENFNLYIVSSSIDDTDNLKARQYNLVKGFLLKPLDKSTISEFLNGNSSSQ
jgi:two-component system, chemotaxis family, chemotaxis protein CheY